jgi:hypothetical protein
MKNKRQIIFCPTISDIDTIIAILHKQHIKALKYNGAMERQEKVDIWNSFINSDLNSNNILVGTIAAGLGADCQDIRQVIVFSACAGWEWWAQMGGRAGRDGEVAKVIYVYANETIEEQRRREKNEEKLFEFNLFVDAVENSNQCMRSALVQYIDGSKVGSCVGLDGSYQRCSHCNAMIQSTKLSEIRPTSTVSRALTFGENSLVRNLNNVVSNVMHFLKTIVIRNENFCPVCFVGLKPFNHKACSANRCLFCFGNHFVNSCQAKKAANNIPLGCCYYCLLPLDTIASTTFHIGSIERNKPESCNSLGREVIIPTCLVVFNLGSSSDIGLKSLIPNEYQSQVTEYVKWLITFADERIPIVNAVYLFSKIIVTRQDMYFSAMTLNQV